MSEVPWLRCDSVVEDLPNGHHGENDQINKPGILGKAHRPRLPFSLVPGLPFHRLLLLLLV